MLVVRIDTFDPKIRDIKVCYFSLHLSYKQSNEYFAYNRTAWVKYFFVKFCKIINLFNKTSKINQSK